MTRTLRSAAAALLAACGAAALLVAVPPLDYEGLAERIGFAGRIVWALGGWGAPRIAGGAAFFGAGLAALAFGAAALAAALRARGVAVRLGAREWIAIAATAMTLLPTRGGMPFAAQLVWSTAGALLVASAAACIAVPHLDGRLPEPPPIGLSALLATCFALLASRFVFHGLPRISDGASQLFQARVFATGHLFTAPPRMPEFFSGASMVANDGRWFSMYPPGHSLLLAPFAAASAPWLLDPLLLGLGVLLVGRLGTELYGERTGRLAALLTCLSPFAVFLSSEYMNHPTAMAAFAGFLLFAVRSARSGRLAEGAAAGLAGGLLVATRPYTALALLVATAAVSRLLIGRRPIPWRAWGALLAAGAACVALVLAYNRATTGSPLVFGYEKLYGERLLPGFHKAAWGAPLTPARAAENARTNVAALQGGAFGWPIPSLAAAAGLLVSRRVRREDIALALCAAALLAAYTFYWSFALAFGPRFLYESLPCVVLLTARGLLEAESWLAERGLAGPGRVAFGAALAWMALVPLPGLARIYGSDYLGGTDRGVLAVRDAGIERGLVFVTSFYPTAFSQNAPGLDAPIVYARDRGADDVRLMALYPDRPAFREIGGRLVPLSR